MRLLSMTAVALALSTGVAMAQMGPTPSGTTTPGGGPIGAPAVQHVPAVNPLTTEDVSHITGTTVYGSDDKKVGSISHVLMTPDSKTIDRLVVAEGGLLGVGAHNVALPIDQFKWDQQKEGFTIGKTTDDLKSMAAWQDPWREAMATPGPGATPSH
jgi:hypothetical protein